MTLNLSNMDRLKFLNKKMEDPIQELEKYYSKRVFAKIKTYD